MPCLYNNDDSIPQLSQFVHIHIYNIITMYTHVSQIHYENLYCYNLKSHYENLVT